MSIKPWRLSWGGHALSLVERRRAQAILQRIRALSRFFAAATVAWIPLDALVFDGSIAARLGLARGTAALALLWISHHASHAQPTMADARRRSVLLFCIPAVFYIASLQIFHGASFDGREAIVANAYSFAPFLAAAGIAAFPLSIVECAALLLIALAAEAFALQWHWGETPFITAEALWLQLLIGSVASFAAVSQRALFGELTSQAAKDPLTGCHRRESGRELLAMHFHLACRRDAPLAALFMDLDRFKRVNDELGHEAGDRVLASAATSMRAVLRLSDVLVRWGGEEFLMVLPNTRMEDALVIAERIRAVASCTVANGQRITMSIGIAERIGDAVADPDALVVLADRRMYAAKQAGRDRCVASGELHARAA